MWSTDFAAGWQKMIGAGRRMKFGGGRFGTEGDAFADVKTVENEVLSARPAWLGTGAWAEEAWELLKQQEAEGRMRPAERVLRKLQHEDWKFLLRMTELYAERQIARRWWRGQKAAESVRNPQEEVIVVVPGGYDANSIASEAIMTVLEGKGRIVLGWTRERLVGELQRLVAGRVRRLNDLKEAKLERSEWDILPPDEDGEERSIFDEIASDELDAAVVLLRKEGFGQLEVVEREIEAELVDDTEAKGVFGCLWDGVRKRSEIARRLNVTPEGVTTGRKRLWRSLQRYLATHRDVPETLCEELLRGWTRESSPERRDREPFGAGRRRREA